MSAAANLAAYRPRFGGRQRMQSRCDDTSVRDAVVYDWGSDGAATCGPRGSPFQLPAELADGLGPWKWPEQRFALLFAPSRIPPGIWVPRVGLQEGRPASAATNVPIAQMQGLSSGQRKIWKVCAPPKDFDFSVFPNLNAHAA
jgi:hypothetical protein